jgi:hypothetical protein
MSWLVYIINWLGHPRFQTPRAPRRKSRPALHRGRGKSSGGHRLARIDAPLPEGATGMAGVIVPRKTVNELRKLLDNPETE